MRAHTLAAAVICCLAVASVCRPVSAFNLRASKVGDDAASCHNSTSITECHRKTNCTWCQSTIFPSGCWADSEAKFLPGFAYHCEDAPSAAQPALGCMLKASEAECSAAEQCAWCNGLLGASCFSKEQAQMLPLRFYTCKETGTAKLKLQLAAAAAAAPAPGPGPGMSCSGPTDRKACRKQPGCVWCHGSFGPAACYSEDQAKFLPAQFFKCSKPKHSDGKHTKGSSIDAAAAAAAAPVPGPGPGMSCSGPTDRKACRKQPGCVWCDGSFGPAACYSEDHAKFLPAQFFKCSKPRHNDDDKHSKSSSSGAAAPAAAAAAPAPGPGPGMSCSGPTDRKACRKQAGCVWCEGSFGPGACYSEDQAKFLPAQFFKCSKPKHGSDEDDQDNGSGAAVAAA